MNQTQQIIQTNISNSSLSQQQVEEENETIYSKLSFNNTLDQFDNNNNNNNNSVTISGYKDETQLPSIMQLIGKDLSEPYSIFTYRYFLNHWPGFAFLAHDNYGKLVGAIVSKLDWHKDRQRGYIAMLAVDANYRKLGIGSKLVQSSIESMKIAGADEIVLEAEATNLAALKLYQHLGFVKDKRMFRYYLTGIDAFRLKLWLN